MLITNYLTSDSFKSSQKLLVHLRLPDIIIRLASLVFKSQGNLALFILTSFKYDMDEHMCSYSYV